MEYIVVKSQAELDAVPVDTDKTIRIEFGTAECPAVVSKKYRHFIKAYDSTIEARDSSTVEAYDNSFVEAYDNSFVKACDNSFVEAYNNSRVEAYNNSRVEAQDNSRVEARDSSSVVAWGSSTVKAYDSSSVVAWDRSYVEAWENSSVRAVRSSTVKAHGSSSVVAWDRSYVEAWENSSVEACNNSLVEAYNNSRVEAYNNSTVTAWDRSSVIALENSIVVAQDRSSVEAWGNVQICKDKTFRGEITTHANARVVAMPKCVDEFLDFYGIHHDESTAVLYKAVHKIDEDGTIKFVSDYDKAFEYKIGEKICSYGFDINSETACSQGIHVAHLDWALNFGAGWDNLAILELKVNLSDIVIPDDSDGKVRVPEALVIREVPLEECGVYGKILARRRKK